MTHPQKRLSRFTRCQVVDALNWFGSFKLFGALTDAAFYNRNREFALGGQMPQRFMGYWSDGAAANYLLSSDRPIRSW